MPDAKIIPLYPPPTPAAALAEVQARPYLREMVEADARAEQTRRELRRQLVRLEVEIVAHLGKPGYARLVRQRAHIIARLGECDAESLGGAA